MRLFIVSIAVCFAVGFIILTTRIWGLGQNYKLYEHDFFKGNTPLVIMKADTLPDIEAAVKLKPDVVIWLDVRMSSDKNIFVLDPLKDAQFLSAKKVEQEPILKGSKLSDYGWEQINEYYKDTPALKEIYDHFPQTRFVLNVVDNVMDVHTTMIAAINDSHPDKRTLIQSDALVLVDNIKELKPVWVYGTSLPDLMRLMSLDSLYVLPATEFKGDVFVAPFKVMNRPAFNEDIINEMKRRHKRIFLGPVQSKEEFDEASRYQVNGYITDNLPQLMQWLDQHRVQ
jgi:glycerophosphoryl diester phosphodiesterase